MHPPAARRNDYPLKTIAAAAAATTTTPSATGSVIPTKAFLCILILHTLSVSEGFENTNSNNMVMGMVENADGTNDLLSPPDQANVWTMMNETVKEYQQNMESTTDAAATITADDTSSRTCGVWIAPSTIPGAGIGLFAGRDYEPFEQLLETGDVAIPIVDIVASQADDSHFKFLWDEYTWSAESVKVFMEGINEVNVASNGFGAVANCQLPLVNVEEWYCKNDYADNDLHRSRDPGAGASSPYHDRTATAKQNGLVAGEELFVSYGSNWFTTRPQMGPIPLFDDIDRATTLYRRFSFLSRHTDLDEKILDELWDVFVRNTSFKDSRTIGAFHHDDPDELKKLQHRSLKKIRREESTRSVEWLQEHGRCADYMRAGASTIPQAGRGAFATQELKAGEVVAPLPLIHLLNRERLAMYDFTITPQDEFIHHPEKGIQGYQLLLNYCMGHADSSLLLCPYGPMTMLVNHNKTMANVKVRWADPSRSNHMPELLESSLSRLETDATAKLAMELVAIKDIKEGEEIFMDYGDEWENAWVKHVQEWEPVEDAQDYVPAWYINSDRSIRLPTEFEKLEGDNEYYHSNLDIKCDGAIMAGSEWREHYMEGTLEEYLLDADNEYWDCEILRYRVLNDGEILYTVLMLRDGDDLYGEYEIEGKERRRGGHEYRVENVPREIFAVMDKPYTSDIHLKNAFRHDMRVPDELFPESWKNRKHRKNRPQ